MAAGHRQAGRLAHPRHHRPGPPAPRRRRAGHAGRPWGRGGAAGRAPTSASTTGSTWTPAAWWSSAPERDANAGLARSFAEREARKVYLAVAADAGRPSRRIGERWTVRNHLGRTSDRRERARYGPVRSGGDRAETTFTLLERRPGRRVLLQAEPHTGRSHQIRVHAAGAGLPLVGDVLYGGPPAARVLLHARALSLPHPVTGAELVLEAPVPAELT
ncbi:MAG: pseudouridine synthase [Acidimicrobiales bacterium]